MFVWRGIFFNFKVHLNLHKFKPSGMRKFYALSFALVLLASCKNGTKPTAAAEMSTNMLTKILGSFVGPFGENKITLLITKAEKGIVEGRSIVGGNDRPFSGTITEVNGIYAVSAKEPGDDANDGTFTFKIDPADPNAITGSWQPLDNSTIKDYKLVRKDFLYRTDVGMYPSASQRELKPEEVEEMMKSDLEQMRNEIYARHGYCFKKKEMRSQFEDLDWYVPNSTDIRSKLTDIEKKNIALIKRYEKYAEDYGDDFGR
jgi:hypothetical protein